MNYKTNTCNSKLVDYNIQYSNYKTPHFQNEFYNYNLNLNIPKNHIFTFKNQSEDNSNNEDNNLSYTYNYLDYSNKFLSIDLNYNTYRSGSSDNIFMQKQQKYNKYINSILDCSLGSRSDDYNIQYSYVRSRNDKHNESLLHINSENNTIKGLHEKTTIKDNINLCSSIKEELKKFSKNYLFSIDDSYLISQENINKWKNGIESCMARMLDTKNYDTIPYIKKSDKERTNDLCNNMIDYYNTHQMYIDKRKNNSIINDIPFIVLQIMYSTIEKHEQNIVDEAIKNIYIRNKQQVLEWK